MKTLIIVLFLLPVNLFFISSRIIENNQSMDKTLNNKYYSNSEFLVRYEKPSYSAQDYGTPERKVLLESFSNTHCSGCASQNPFLHNFVSQYTDSIVAVCYHIFFPSPADPMYQHNTSQSDERKNYYSVNCVPVTKIDGILQSGTCAGCNYSTSGCLSNPYQQRRQISPLITVSVTNYEKVNDSVRTVIVVNNLNDLPTGVSYYLKVLVAEKAVIFASPPGPYGETNFPNVFRRAIPNSTGTLHPIDAGIYTYEFKFRMDPVYADSMIYTAAFIQREDTKEVLNAGSSLHNKNKTCSLSVLIEGMYSVSTGKMNADTASLYLRNSVSPYSVIDSSKGHVDSAGTCIFSFKNANEQNSYYLFFNHRNSLNTWSGMAKNFSSGIMTYDFTDSASKAYGNNLIQKSNKYCIFSGDVNKDILLMVQTICWWIMMLQVLLQDMQGQILPGI